MLNSIQVLFCQIGEKIFHISKVIAHKKNLEEVLYMSLVTKIDLALKFFGELSLINSFNKKISHLKMSADDVFCCQILSQKIMLI